LTSLLLVEYFYRQGRFEYPESYLMPRGLYEVLAIAPPGSETILSLHKYILLLLAAALLGFYTRTLVFSALLLCLYVLGAKHNYGFPHHLESLLIFALAAVACSDPGNGKGWLLRFFQVYFVFVMFSAGLLKIINGGWAWIDSDMLRHVLYMRKLTFGSTTGLENWLLSHSQITKVASLATLTLELASPLLIAPWPVFKKPILAASLLMLSSVYLILGHEFLFYLAPYLASFLPWDKIKFPAAQRA
jgi:hypothetical protein